MSTNKQPGGGAVLRPRGKGANDRALAGKADALERARGLLPKFRERAAETERLRHAHDDSIAELHEAGLFGILVPKRWGRSELTIADLVDVAIEVSAACGSTGWVYSLLSMHLWWTCLFPEEGQREVFADPNSLMASCVVAGEVEQVEGGYMWRNGRGRFATGIDHANWLMASLRPTGPGALAGHFLIPRGDVQIEDDWYVMGQKGTGSKTVLVNDVFVPEYRFAPRAGLMEGRAPGSLVHANPLYRRPIHSVMPFALAAPSIGIARAAIDSYRAGLRNKFGSASAEAIADQSSAFYHLSKATVDVDAAYALLMADADRLERMPDPAEFTQFETARLRRDVAFVGQQCRHAVNSLFEALGGSASFEGNDMQRIFRDSNVAAAHGGLSWDTAGLLYGRLDVGLQPSSFDRSGRKIASLSGALT